jgi:hypothetical protein
MNLFQIINQKWSLLKGCITTRFQTLMEQTAWIPNLQLLRLHNAQKYYVSPTQDGSEVSHSDSWRIGNTPTFYPSLYRFQFPYRNKKG